MAKHVIIIGGGFAGISAAKKLTSSEFEVTIIDKANHHLFQPLLYQVATAALSPGDIATPIRAIFGENRNVKVILGEVSDINKAENFISLKDGSTHYFDYLIVAVGAQYNYFGHSDWEEYAPGLKSLSDALQIRERILLSLEKAEQLDSPEKRRPYLTYVVIGGGPTGVEMAGSIAEIAKRNMMRDYRNFSKDETKVFLVEAAPQILNGFPEPLPKKGIHALEKMGVQVLLKTPVSAIKENGVELGDNFIETPNIIWAAGVAASPLLKTLDAEYDRMGRVKVEKDLSIPEYPNIFVLGDAAYLEDKDGKPLPGLAPVALQQGKYAGKIIKKGIPKTERKPFVYHDKGSMATIGRAKAVANIRGFKLTGFLAWLIWGFIHIIYLIGFRNRYRVFAEWVWNYITFKRGVRLITRKKAKI